MKHIIIPTDFTVASLQPVHTVVKHYQPEEIKISLLHLLESPSGFQDIFTKWANTDLKNNISKEFTTACEILQSKYSSTLLSVDIMIKHGSSSAYLQNLLEGYNADAIWITESLAFHRPCKQSVDLYRLLKKVRFPVNRVPAMLNVASVGNSISELLVNDTLEVNYKMA